MAHDITALIARILRIPEAQVTDDLAYQSISEWDSFSHVSLILALEEEWGIAVDSTLFVQLTSVAAIRTYLLSLDAGEHRHTTDFVQSRTPSEQEKPSRKKEEGKNEVQQSSPPIYRGLAGIAFDTSTITHIDGEQGALSYRGYSIENLVAHARFEEVAYLLLHNHLPTTQQLQDFVASLQEVQELPQPVLALIEAMTAAHPIDVLRTAVSMLAAFDAVQQAESYDDLRARGVRLMAQIPLIIAAHERLRHQQAILRPQAHLSFAANFLYLLTGREPSAQHTHIINSDLILHADHSSNAATFVARIATSTRSELHAVITAAIAAFAGTLHGGAVEQILTMLQEIGEPQRAAAYVQSQRLQNQSIPGFGHRVYRTEDPRAIQMRRMVRELSAESGERKWLEIADAVIVAMHPYRRHGIHINVDFYAGILYHLLALPQDISVPLFILGRMAGWLAHILEQRERNILIRPLLHYVGEEPRPYVRGEDL